MLVIPGIPGTRVYPVPRYALSSVRTATWVYRDPSTEYTWDPGTSGSRVYQGRRVVRCFGQLCFWSYPCSLWFRLSQDQTSKRCFSLTRPSYKFITYSIREWVPGNDYSPADLPFGQTSWLPSPGASGKVPPGSAGRFPQKARNAKRCNATEFTAKPSNAKPGNAKNNAMQSKALQSNIKQCEEQLVSKQRTAKQCYAYQSNGLPCNPKQSPKQS